MRFLGRVLLPIVLTAAPLASYAQQGAMSFSALPLAGSPGTSAPSATDQVLIEQGVTIPGTGKPARMMLSQVGTLGFTSINLAPIAAPSAPSSGGALYVDSANVLHYSSSGGGLQIDANPNSIIPLFNAPSVPSNTFYTNLASPHPTIVRLGDRVTLGYTNADPLVANPTTSQYSWAGQATSSGKMGWLERDAALSVFTTHGGPSLVAASRASDYNEDGATQSAQGIAAFGLADGSAHSVGEGAYFEGRTVNTLGTAVGVEVDAGNYGGALPSPDISPYQSNGPGDAIGILLGAGGDPSTPGPVYESSAAMLISANASTFASGIVFSSAALTGNNGITGTASAIQLPKGDEIDWFYNGAPPGIGARIRSDVTSGGSAITFENPAIHFQDANQVNEYLFNTPVSTTSGFQLTPGSVPQIAAWSSASTTAAIGIQLAGQANGSVNLNNGNGPIATFNASTVTTPTLGWLAVSTSTSATGTVNINDQTSAGTEALNLGLGTQANGFVSVKNANGPIAVFSAGPASTPTLGWLTFEGSTTATGNVGIGITTSAGTENLNLALSAQASGQIKALSEFDATVGLTSGGPITLMHYTVATLPTCNSAAKYEMAAVSDATTPTYNAALTGGGTVSVPVYCDGSAWTSH